jgi:hypothetical protein
MDEPPPAPILRREEFVDVGQDRILILYVNDVGSITVNGLSYNAQLDENGKKMFVIDGEIHYPVKQPYGPLLEAMRNCRSLKTPSLLQ